MFNTDLIDTYPNNLRKFNAVVISKQKKLPMLCSKESKSKANFKSGKVAF
jgi:hypothetical protein